MARIVQLDWNKFGNYIDIKNIISSGTPWPSKPGTQRGVYLWLENVHINGVLTDKADMENIKPFSIINYIGKHESDLLYRNQYHIIHQLSLIYPIPPAYIECEYGKIPSFLKNGWYQDVDKNFELYLEYLSSIKDSSKIKKCAISYLNNIEIYFAVTKESPSDIERNLIYQLQPVDNRKCCGSDAAANKKIHFEHCNLPKDIEKYFDNTCEYLSHSPNKPSKPSNKRFGNRWGERDESEIYRIYGKAKKSW